MVRGFTLLELSVVMVILAILAVATIPNIAEENNRVRANLTIDEIQTFSEAARLFAALEIPVGNNPWPDAQNNCAGAIAALLQNDKYLKGIDVKSPWNTDYKTSCNENTFSVEVESKPEITGLFINSIAATQLKAGTTNTTVTTVPLPGSIPALKNVLHRVNDSSKPELNQMETALVMTPTTGSKAGQAQDITGAGTISGKTFVDADDNRFFLDPNTRSTIREVTVQNARAGNAAADPFALAVLNNVGVRNRQARNKQGSLDVNDIFLRSVGQNGQFLSTLVGLPCDWVGLSQCNGRIDNGSDGSYSTVRLFCQGGIITRAHQALAQTSECFLQ